MRSCFVLAGRSVQFTLATVRGIHWSKSSRLFLFAAAAAFALLALHNDSSTTFATKAAFAQDPNPPGPDEDDPEAHAPPEIVNFSATTDGFGNYELSGTVVNCDEVANLEIRFDGAAAGATAITNSFGDFHRTLYLPDFGGCPAYAQTTCHEGLDSNMACTVLP